MNTELPFAGLWAIILGGSSGFGFATAEKLASKGMNLAVLFREPSGPAKKATEALAEIAAENNVEILSYNLNVLDNSSRISFIDEFGIPDRLGKVKLLMHSVARGNLKPLVEPKGETGQHSLLTVEDIQMTSYAMGNSLLDWTRDILNAGLFHQDSRIIGLTSEGADKYWDAYAAVSIAKASLQSLTTYMAVEFAPYGLRTNLIQAGITNTAALQRIPGSDKLVEIAETRNPLQRMTVPGDVANVIYLLCTDEAAWINGALLHVDGGEHCR
ncbi:SDR family oxidoreductase [Mucilaginibacter myungsuensis]|uniref:SDR family oxidoreductase n=1 Tax=Mucilaginibacter myungsuensis TaxID=649104 RepID=A0A929PWZ0_9SPHI|nr:SDR family oxidoreductase [Mucilaginibacter myungsuensis]MBE9663333.1 SDR family oxidoreductase [Mucilaginibacter myungsuensis]MDN3600068.1 SDR family oxidoreductase [Mucilaginibacter myungsuensis]